jgi:hypothetical protein
MPKYHVVLSTTKTVVITAIDEQDAIDKAEEKVNKTNNKWTAETACLETGDNK